MAFPIASGRPAGRAPGFTLVELLVVLAIVATLLTLVAPQYFGTVDRAKDTVLKEDLSVMRDAIDKYYGDTGKYPASLTVLAEKRYLRAVPVDPLTEKRDTWVEIRASAPGVEGIVDVQSGATGKDSNDVQYKDY